MKCEILFTNISINVLISSIKLSITLTVRSREVCKYIKNNEFIRACFRLKFYFHNEAHNFNFKPNYRVQPVWNMKKSCKAMNLIESKFIIYGNEVFFIFIILVSILASQRLHTVKMIKNLFSTILLLVLSTSLIVCARGNNPQNDGKIQSKFFP